MPEWEPITLVDLNYQIQRTEGDLNGELWNFWQLIKIDPVKWSEKDYGTEGGGFWVIAICGKKVIWYNDIEEGFNISNYKELGSIAEYHCNQDELSWVVIRLFEMVKSGGSLLGQVGPPEPLNWK